MQTGVSAPYRTALKGVVGVVRLLVEAKADSYIQTKVHTLSYIIGLVI